jgi:hypothetical protein
MEESEIIRKPIMKKDRKETGNIRRREKDTEGKRKYRQKKGRGGNETEGKVRNQTRKV